MRSNKKYIVLLMIILSTACKKFLDVNPSTTAVNPSTIKDFGEMLNSDSLGIGYFFLPDVMSDDIRISDYYLQYTSNIYTRVYKWDATFWNPGDTDVIYNAAYTRILQMNIILDRVNSAPSDNLNTAANKSNIISQALINRAWIYLQLANIYGPAYTESTASSSLAVPLITKPNSTNYPSRATVKQVYNQVIADLKTAVQNPYLPAKGVDIIHPGKAAGFTLLARAYLYQARYDSAKTYADSSLSLASTLINYNTSYKQPTRLYDLTSNPEVLLGHVSYDTKYPALFSTSGFSLNAAFADSLGNSDLRYSKNFTWGSFNVSYTLNNPSLVLDNSVSIPETMLIKAECLARQGDVSGAAAIVKTIRNNRLASGTTDNRDYNTSNILSYVLSERRRELFCHGGLTLFDLKRFNNENTLMRTIYRINDSGTITDSLLPGSNRYLVPFSQTIIANNPNIVQNPR